MNVKPIIRLSYFLNITFLSWTRKWFSKIPLWAWLSSVNFVRPLRIIVSLRLQNAFDQRSNVFDCRCTCYWNYIVCWTRRINRRKRNVRMLDCYWLPSTVISGRYQGYELVSLFYDFYDEHVFTTRRLIHRTSKLGSILDRIDHVQLLKPTVSNFVSRGKIYWNHTQKYMFLSIIFFRDLRFTISLSVVPKT